MQKHLMQLVCNSKTHIHVYQDADSVQSVNQDIIQGKMEESSKLWQKDNQKTKACKKKLKYYCRFNIRWQND